MLSEDDDLVPIRMVESVRYCPRQAWYHFVAGEDAFNLAMERGLRRHASLEHRPAEAPTPDAWAARNVTVCAPDLGVTGVLDEIEVSAQLVITEYKSTRLSRWLWPGTRAQLAVQHLALREMAAGGRWHGPALPERTVVRAYCTESRRYVAVQWTAALDAEARSVVQEARAILAMTLPPAGNEGVRCNGCQYMRVCLPAERRKLLAEAR